MLANHLFIFGGYRNRHRLTDRKTSTGHHFQFRQEPLLTEPEKPFRKDEMRLALFRRKL